MAEPTETRSEPRLTVACLQIAGQDLPDPSARRAAAERALADCPPADLLVLPELWPVGFFHFDDYATHAEHPAGPTLDWLSTVARERACWVHGGSTVERDPGTGRLHNSSLLVDPRGDVRSVYRKAHLFGYQSREAALLSPGTPVAPVPVGPFTAGLATCYDLRFPEQFRWLLDHGADLFVITSAWPLNRLDHWRLLCRTRALENQAWLVACNATGTDNGVTLGGHSLVVDPWGEIVAEGPEGPGTVHAELDFDRLATLRAEYPFIQDRHSLPTLSAAFAKAPTFVPKW